MPWRRLSRLNPGHQFIHFAIVRPCSRFQTSPGLRSPGLPWRQRARPERLRGHGTEVRYPGATVILYRHGRDSPRSAGAARRRAPICVGSGARDGSRLLQRATEVTAETLQPSLMAGVASRWLYLNPRSLDAQRAAARAALALYKVDEAAAHYRIVLLNSPVGLDAEFADVETDLGSDENVFGAHQLADRLASYFPTSPSALRVQGLAALRADDPAAAVHSLTSALAIDTRNATAAQSAHKELAQTLLRARILAGDVEEPLSAALTQLKADDSPTNRFNYVALLMTAQRLPEATEQLEILARNPDSMRWRCACWDCWSFSRAISTPRRRNSDSC